MDVADAAAETIGGWFPRGKDGLRRSAVHPGAFTTRELERLSTETPAVLIAFLRTRANENAGDEDWMGEGDGFAAEPPVALLSPARRDVEAEYSAAVVARGQGRGDEAERVAEAIATELARRIPEQRWGFREKHPETVIQPATHVELENRFDQRLAEKHMALWTVGWRQKVRIGSPWPEGATPTTLCISIDGVEEIVDGEPA